MKSTNIFSVISFVWLCIAMGDNAMSGTELPQRLVAVGYLLALILIAFRQKMGVWLYVAMLVVSFFISPISSRYEPDFVARVMGVIMLAGAGAFILLLRAGGTNQWNKIMGHPRSKYVK